MIGGRLQLAALSVGITSVGITADHCGRRVLGLLSTAKESSNFRRGTHVFGDVFNKPLQQVNCSSQRCHDDGTVPRPFGEVLRLRQIADASELLPPLGMVGVGVTGVLQFSGQVCSQCLQVLHQRMHKFGGCLPGDQSDTLPGPHGNKIRVVFPCSFCP